MPDLYEVLSLQPGARQDQVKAAFHRLAKASHPDLNADDAMAEKRFREINHAYEILSNPGSRAAYDLGLKHKRAKGHRAMARVIGSMAAAFLLTIGCVLYLWHAGRLEEDYAPAEVSKLPKQSGASQQAGDLAEVGSKTFGNIPPMSDSGGSRGNSANSQPATSPTTEPKPSVPVPEGEQTGVSTGPRIIDVTVSPKASTPGRQVECERILRVHVKGMQMIEVGDIVAARHLFAWAADAGLCRSAWELARTYDPHAFSNLDVRLAPDGEVAQKWYQKARDLCATRRPLCTAADGDLARLRAAR